MPRSLNPRLVTLKPALPYPVRRAPEPPAVDAWHAYIQQNFPHSPLADRVPADPIPIWQPPAPEYYPSVSFIRDYPHQGQIEPVLQQIEQSQRSQLEYSGKFAPDLPYPLRIHVASHTGLPGFAYGAVPPFDPAQAIETARAFLTNNRATFGFQDVDNELRAADTLGIQEAAGLIHVRYQQWYQDTPVYGGQVMMHMGRGAGSSGRHPGYVTSSYFPIPPGRSFTASIETRAAIRRARQALAARLAGPGVVQLLAEAVPVPDPDANPKHAKLLQQLEQLAARRQETAGTLAQLKAGLAQMFPVNARQLAAMLDATYNVPAVFRLADPPQGPFDSFGEALAPWLDLNQEREPFNVPSLDFLRVPVDAIDRGLQPLLQTLVGQRTQAAWALRSFTASLAAALPNLEDPHELQTLAAGLWQQWEEQFDLPEWRAEVAPYAGREAVILPFAGDYHLVYRVELLAPTEDDGWRVFVDAETGAIVGEPEHLLMHAPQYYATSRDLHPNAAVSTFSAADRANLVQDLAAAGVEWKFHSDQGGAAFSVATLADEAAPVAQYRFDAVNIAYHTWKTYRHFVDVGKLTIPNPPRLSIRVGRKGGTFEMGFIPTSATFEGRIIFQTHDQQAFAQGLLAEGTRHVFSPSLDPDVVIHEVVHGLMWLVNPNPFDQQHDDVPFGRALLEGYATYLAHSLTARQDPANESWASATYRDPAWGDRWDLAIEPQPASGVAGGADEGVRALAIPNYYPLEETKGLPVYDVSMVWARALWDVRGLLASAQALGLAEPQRLDLADELVLQSYLSVHGWSSNFEMAAEALIAAARTILKAAPWQLSDAQIKPVVTQIIQTFAARGILADYGIQALRQVTQGGQTVWLVGTDTGVRMSTSLTLPWPHWTPLAANGNPLPGTIALATGPGGTPVYIATEAGVYQWDNGQAGSQATRMGNQELDGERLQALLFAGGSLRAGTNRRLWRFDAAAATWRVWDQGNVPRLVLDLKQITVQDPANQPRLIALAHTPHQILWAEVTNSPSWKNVRIVNAAGARVTIDWVTSIEVIDNSTLYIVTLAGDVWPLTGLSLIQEGSAVVLRGTATLSLPRGTLGTARVLQLVATNGQPLYAATTAGVFEHNLNPAAGWSSVPLAAGSVPVLRIVRTANELVAGTAGQGLLVQTITPAGVNESNLAVDQ